MNNSIDQKFEIYLNQLSNIIQSAQDALAYLNNINRDIPSDVDIANIFIKLALSRKLIELVEDITIDVKVDNTTSDLKRELLDKFEEFTVMCHNIESIATEIFQNIYPYDNLEEKMNTFLSDNAMSLSSIIPNVEFCG